MTYLFLLITFFISLTELKKTFIELKDMDLKRSIKSTQA